jgi:hypothetical protein
MFVEKEGFLLRHCFLWIKKKKNDCEKKNNKEVQNFP